jgi:DNA topoisomerase-1
MSREAGLTNSVVIVESPAKAKTINKYLGKGYEVLASFGHVRDLVDKDGSVDPDNDFAMLWDVDTRSAKRIADIARAVKESRPRHPRHRPGSRGRGDFLASAGGAQRQEGAEGQADPARRLQRHHQRGRARGDAEPARHRPCAGRRLSRPPRARLSRRLQPLAGAVAQAAGRALGGARAIGGAATRLRPRAGNREIRQARILVAGRTSEDEGRRALHRALVGADGKKISRLDIGAGKEAEAFKAALDTAKFIVASVEAKPAKRHPYAPFTTSTLQQEASRKLGLAPARTMQLAQRLYEGVDIGGETVGLITYMRTDGVDMAPEAVAAARRDRQGIRRRLRAEGSAQIHHQGQERAGSARGHPPDRSRPLPKMVVKRQLDPDQARSTI